MWGASLKLPQGQVESVGSPRVLHSSEPGEKVASIVCGADHPFFLWEADYSYSVATMLHSPEVDEDPQPRHQRTVSHNVLSH